MEVFIKGTIDELKKNSTAVPILNNLSLARLPDLIVKIMEVVERFNLTGADKKICVLEVLKKIVENALPSLSPSLKEALEGFITHIAPSLIESIIQASKNQLDINTVGGCASNCCLSLCCAK
jgi:hypothetical protein